MTQIETIIAEIERLMNWKPKAIPSGMRQRDVLNIRKGVLLTLKAFINSLPAEQPSEELEYLATSLEEAIDTSPHSRETIISYMLQAAQWQKEQTINKASQWLNKNVVEYHPRKGELRPIVNSNAFREAMEKEDEQ